VFRLLICPPFQTWFQLISPRLRCCCCALSPNSNHIPCSNRTLFPRCPKLEAKWEGGNLRAGRGSLCNLDKNAIAPKSVKQRLLVRMSTPSKDRKRSRPADASGLDLQALEPQMKKIKTVGAFETQLSRICDNLSHMLAFFVQITTTKWSTLPPTIAIFSTLRLQQSTPTFSFTLACRS
jgi:hypothetical protein